MRSPVRPHLPEEELHAFLDGELSSAQRAEIAEHLLACLICRALEGEVQTTRDQANVLLAIVAPPASRYAGRTLPRRRPIRRLRPAAAAVLAVAAAGSSWVAFRPGLGAPSASSPTLAASVAPAFVAALATAATPTLQESSTPSAGKTASRADRLASAMTSRLSPRVVGSPQAESYTLRPRSTIDPLTEIVPTSSGTPWQSASYADARQESPAIAHLNGLPVSAVRLQPSVDGTRPASMVRQLLPDGQAVWVIEGVESSVQDVARVMQASGLTIGLTRRTAPDYIGSADNPVRVLRMVTVASYIPFDSLQTLARERLRLDNATQ